MDLGVRFDYDTITHSTHPAPRAGFLLALTNDGKTLLKGGVGLFYDRVSLMAATFVDLPDRTVTLLSENGEPTSSLAYRNQTDGGLRNPRSTSWSLELDRQVFSTLTLATCRWGARRRLGSLAERSTGWARYVVCVEPLTVTSSAGTFRRVRTGRPVQVASRILSIVESVKASESRARPPSADQQAAEAVASGRPEVSRPFR